MEGGLDMRSVPCAESTFEYLDICSNRPDDGNRVPAFPARERRNDDGIQCCG